jgi:hypothetical protein
MNSLLKYGLIAGAAWFLFKDQIEAMFGTATSTAAAPATSNPAAPATPATPANPAAPAAPVVTATTRTLLQNWANANSFYKSQNNVMSAYQWDYGYQAVRGAAPPGPDVMFPGQDPNRLMTLDEYLTAAAASGLSGVRPKRSAAARAWRY